MAEVTEVGSGSAHKQRSSVLKLSALSSLMHQARVGIKRRADQAKAQLQARGPPQLWSRIRTSLRLKHELAPQRKHYL